MPQKFPTPDTVHPILAPDGEPYRGTVFLKTVIDHPNIEVGDYTYYSDLGPEPVKDHAAHLAPYLYPGAPERLTIGKFCQIAHGVKIITSSANHALHGMTTYPFPVFDNALIGAYGETLSAQMRDTVIGHDCWIGYGAVILPGARIGNGVIIGAGAVVSGEVEDYAVVAGNPARLVRHRFAEPHRERLTALAWWDWPIDAILDALPVLLGNDPKKLETLAPPERD